MAQISDTKLATLWKIVCDATGDDFEAIPDDVLSDEEMLIDAAIAAMGEGYDISEVVETLGLDEE